MGPAMEKSCFCPWCGRRIHVRSATETRRGKCGSCQKRIRTEVIDGDVRVLADTSSARRRTRTDRSRSSDSQVQPASNESVVGQFDTWMETATPPDEAGKTSLSEERPVAVVADAERPAAVPAQGNPSSGSNGAAAEPSGGRRHSNLRNWAYFWLLVVISYSAFTDFAMSHLTDRRLYGSARLAMCLVILGDYIVLRLLIDNLFRRWQTLRNVGLGIIDVVSVVVMSAVANPIYVVGLVTRVEDLLPPVMLQAIVQVPSLVVAYLAFALQVCFLLWDIEQIRSGVAGTIRAFGELGNRILFVLSDACLWALTEFKVESRVRTLRERLSESVVFEVLVSIGRQCARLGRWMLQFSREAFLLAVAVAVIFAAIQLHAWIGQRLVEEPKPFGRQAIPGASDEGEAAEDALATDGDESGDPEPSVDDAAAEENGGSNASEDRQPAAGEGGAVPQSGSPDAADAST